MKFFLPLGAAASLLALSGCVEPNDTAGAPPPSSVVYASADGGTVPSETTYVPPGTYATAPSYSQDDYDDSGAPVPSEGEIDVETVQDFDEPLQPYGDWVVVPNYGRCWRPRRVDSNWRPYCDGSWVDTDQGWYWQSDEPWGWATYHYGRWDFQAGLGWFWVPRTRWAPAWVEWRTGGGYVGWAPLPPGARFNKGSHEFHEVHAPDHNFVFVHENHFDQRVRPSTVVVNNTTIYHHTTGISSITIVNNRVHDVGPRADVVAKATGHPFRPTPAVQLRRQMERPIAAKHPTLTRPHANRPSNNANNSRAQSSGPRGPVGNPAENHQPYGVSPANQNRAQTRPENRPQNNNTAQTNAVHPTANTHPTPAPHPTNPPAHTAIPPAHLNQHVHELNAHPTMKPLHPENHTNELHMAPTMKPLEQHNNTLNALHSNRPSNPPPPVQQRPATQEPRETVSTQHRVEAPPPQARPQLSHTQNPVIAPHNNAPAAAVGPTHNESAAPQHSAPHQTSPQASHTPPQHTVVQHPSPQTSHAVPPRAVVQHPAPQAKTQAPPPSQHRDESQYQQNQQNQPQR